MMLLISPSIGYLRMQMVSRLLPLKICWVAKPPFPMRRTKNNHQLKTYLKMMRMKKMMSKTSKPDPKMPPKDRMSQLNNMSPKRTGSLL